MGGAEGSWQYPPFLFRNEGNLFLCEFINYYIRGTYFVAPAYLKIKGDRSAQPNPGAFIWFRATHLSNNHNKYLRQGLMSLSETLVRVPCLTLGVKLLIIMVTVGSTIVALFGWYPETMVDGYAIFDKGQVYRLLTSVFAVGSLVELAFMLIGFVWMLFQVTEYERKCSTIYTIYHFWIFNILNGFNVASLYNFLFTVTTMKSFNMTLVGIYPYCLYMHLKTCLSRPNEPVDYWFMPFPMSRWTSGLVILIVSVWFSTETQGCIFILLHYIAKTILAKVLYGCCKKDKAQRLLKEGPMFPAIFRCLERILCSCFKNSPIFVPISSTQKENVSTEDEKLKEVDMEMVEQKGSEKVTV